MSVVLGIDQSLTSTGWTVLEDGEVIASGIISSSPKDNVYERINYVSESLVDVFSEYVPEIIVLEGLPFMSRSNVTRDLAGLLHVCVNSLGVWDCLDTTLHIVPPTKLKKFATGSGKHLKVSGENAKEPMFQALPPEVRNRFGKVPKSKGRYDLADSYWLAKYGESL